MAREVNGAAAGRRQAGPVCDDAPELRLHRARPFAGAAPCFARRRSTEEGILQAVPIFGDRAAGDVDIDRLELGDDGVVGEHVVGGLLVDHLLDAEAHRFGRMRLAAARRRDRGGEEIFQFEDAARRHHVFVRGDARDGRFVHADGVGDGAQIERTQMLDALGQEGVLQPHDLGRDLEDRRLALLQALRQPIGVLQAGRDEGLVAVARIGGHLGRIAVVDEHARQGLRIQLDMPGAVGGRAHDHVGDERLDRRVAEGAAGLGIETAHFGGHVGDILGVDAAEAWRAARSRAWRRAGRLATKACIAGS